jgi:G3E family GTPase
VDSRHILQHLDDSDEAVAQIAFADRILLNKTDLVSKSYLVEVRSRIHRINNMASSLPVTMAAAPLAEVLDVGGFDLDRALENRPSFLEPEYPFEWAGLYRLDHGIHTLRCAGGPDPGMSIMLVPVVTDEADQLLTAAEQYFPGFSTQGRVINNHGQIGIAEHLILKLENAEKYIFNLALIKSGYYALFTQHTPAEFDLSLNDLRGNTHKPLHEHYFNAAHDHDDTVSSVSLELDGSVDEEPLMRWLDLLLRSQGQDIFRTKGILSFSGEPNRYVLQGVHMLLESKAGRPWDDEARSCRLVFIGRNLDRDFLRGVFEACKA